MGVGRFRFLFVVFTFGFSNLIQNSISFAGDLESWNEGPIKQTIVDYVKKITDQGSPTFISKEERIAVFDNDGTLWAEKPVPVQFQFVMEMVHQLAPRHPRWRKEQPFKAVLEKNVKYLRHLKEKEAIELLVSTHTGMTQDEFMQSVRNWLNTSKDAKSGLHYPQRAYQPMLELLTYLRDHGFKTYVVTGGGREFVRGFAETTYGIPPEQVIGTSGLMKLIFREGKPTFLREAKPVPPININDGKALNIEREIGRVPVVAVGNGDVDLQMLQYTASSPHPSLKLLVDHDDAVREYEYTQGAEKILAEAKRQHWAIASMKKDFKTIYGK